MNAPLAKRDRPQWPDPKRIDREALPFQPDPLIIDSRPYPWLARSTLYVIIAIVVSGIIWASVSQVERVVVARGKVITIDPLLVVQPLDIGMIRTINVGVGQAVKAGDVLATLDPTFSESEATSHRDRLASLMAEAERLHAELDGVPFPAPDSKLDEANRRLQSTIYANRKAELTAASASFDGQIGNLQAQMATNEAMQGGMKDRVALLGEIEAVRKELWDKKLGSLLALDQSRLDRLSLSDQLRERTHVLKELGERFNATQQDKQKYLNNWKREVGEKLSENQRLVFELRQRLRISERRNTLIVMRAPADGVVLEIAQRSIGSVVKEAETLFSLVPSNTRYEIEAEVETIDVARLRVGDTVRVKLDSLPYQRHGTIDGKLRTVTESSFEPNSNNQGAATKQDGKAFFRARVTLGPLELRGVPPDFRLIPGMTTTAEIIVGKRSIMSYILDPVVNVFHEGLREP